MEGPLVPIRGTVSHPNLELFIQLLNTLFQGLSSAIAIQTRSRTHHLGTEDRPPFAASILDSTVRQQTNIDSAQTVSI